MSLPGPLLEAPTTSRSSYYCRWGSTAGIIELVGVRPEHQGSGTSLTLSYMAAVMASSGSFGVGAEGLHRDCSVPALLFFLFSSLTTPPPPQSPEHLVVKQFFTVYSRLAGKCWDYRCADSKQLSSFSDLGKAPLNQTRALLCLVCTLCSQCDTAGLCLPRGCTWNLF